MILLKNRAIIYLFGDESKSFLQGLVTNDLNKVSANQAIYCFMLSAQGRFLYDFFVSEFDGKLTLDCDAAYADEIIKKLSFYKLRAKVEIQKSDLIVAAFLHKKPENVFCYEDPRTKEMGWRAIGKMEEFAGLEDLGLDAYNYHRIKLKLPDSNDLIYDKSLILEYGFDEFNAIDYKKGCYIGQEVTARTHYRGLVRKQIFLAQIEEVKEIAKNSEIFQNDKVVGQFLSSLFFKEKLYALILIKNPEAENGKLKAEELNLSFGEDRKNISLIS